MHFGGNIKILAKGLALKVGYLGLNYRLLSKGGVRREEGAGWWGGREGWNQEGKGGGEGGGKEGDKRKKGREEERRQRTILSSRMHVDAWNCNSA